MNIYHIVPANLSGITLYPLNMLQEKFSDLAEFHDKKYIGRERLKEVVIPVLNCLWNDVLHFSPIHPTKIKAAFFQYNFTWTPRKWFVFDSEAPVFNKSKTLIFHPPIWRLVNYEVTQSDFESYEEKVLQKYQEFPQISHDYFIKCQSTQVRPYLFNHSAHFLYKGTVRVEGADIIEV